MTMSGNRLYGQFGRMSELNCMGFAIDSICRTSNELLLKI